MASGALMCASNLGWWLQNAKGRRLLQAGHKTWAPYYQAPQIRNTAQMQIRSMIKSLPDTCTRSLSRWLRKVAAWAHHWVSTCTVPFEECIVGQRTMMNPLPIAWRPRSTCIEPCMHDMHCVGPQTQVPATSSVVAIPKD